MSDEMKREGEIMVDQPMLYFHHGGSGRCEKIIIKPIGRFPDNYDDCHHPISMCRPEDVVYLDYSVVKKEEI